MTKKSRPFLVVLLSCSLVAVGGSLFFGVILALFFSFRGYLFEDSSVVPRLYFIVVFLINKLPCWSLIRFGLELRA